MFPRMELQRGAIVRLASVTRLFSAGTVMNLDRERKLAIPDLEVSHLAVACPPSLRGEGEDA
jgi:hypothetical protein